MGIFGLHIVAMLLMPGPLTHPLHLSVTNITYESELLQVDMKTFRDDMETAYFHFHSKPIDFKDEKMREIPWFGNYFEKCFKISLDGGISYLKLRVEETFLKEDALGIRMVTTVTSKPKSLYIYNTLLTDIFPDQTNLVILGSGKGETGIKFDVRNQVAEVALN